MALRTGLSAQGLQSSKMMKNKTETAKATAKKIGEAYALILIMNTTLRQTNSKILD